MRPNRALLALVAVPLAVLGCTQSSRLRGQIAGLEKILEQAEHNGALRCAPRELAIARSQLKFAAIELDQGFASKAEAHLAKAEPNARAAEQLSPPASCTPAGDADGDGYADPLDQCPTKPENYNGYRDEDGCPDDPDSDGDGIADTLDQCELNPEDKDSYLDDDGCPEPDNDLDGFLDAADKCPNEPEDPDGYEDDDGCPDPDNDKDQIPDVKDKCPNEPETYNGFQDQDGCPDKGKVIIEGNDIVILEKVQFETGSAKILPGSNGILDAVAATLKGHPEFTVLEVAGHADERNTDAYNLNLTRLRAAAVMDALKSRGVQGSRLVSQGYGEYCPLDAASNPTAWEKNRRVDFKVVKTEDGLTGVERGCETARGKGVIPPAVQ